jgi:Leucine-rich repeat (LRR) protein
MKFNMRLLGGLHKMKRIVLISSILLTALMLTTWTAWSADVERDALIALYNGTNGGGWTNNTGWNTDADYCSWYGVTCDGSGSVTYLWLDDNQLSGTIPSELGNLSNLWSLYLDHNQLNGPIPSELGSLSNLRDLILGSNQFSGPIPAELGNLSNLQRLFLDQNQLNGPIPAELGNLSNLQYLILSSNQLSGPIPSELANLSSLVTLDLLFNPGLVCWETADALNWALSIDFYYGPEVVCNNFGTFEIHLPIVLR